MKTPKQKAEELVEKFTKDKIICHIPYAGAYANYTTLTVEEAVKVALIACDEIIEAIDWHEFETPNKEFEYWQEVKNELQKM